MTLMSAEQVLHELIAGNRRYVAGKLANPHHDPAARQQVLQGQHPMAVIIACADSRVPPEIIFDQGLGDLFVIRVAGNIADNAVVGSVEYAAEHLGVPLVVVLGHTQCGAVTAAAREGEAHDGHLAGVLAGIRPAVAQARAQGGEVIDAAARIHAANVAEGLRRSEPVLRALVEEGRVRILSALYHLDSGAVEFLEASPGLEEYLAGRDQDYCPERHLLGCVWHGPGYHTRVPDGAWVHPTRDNLDYALALLAAGGREREERARAVIRAVLALQETEPTAATYGLWPWLQEEPLHQMAPPDWNWADFCGARLAHIVADHDDQLDDEVRRRVRAALGHAAWSIFRRNVGPAYTNIAVMGAGVCLAAGELLGEPRLAAYGRARLRRLEAHALEHGGFAEYNSPTYTMVAVHECERILQLVGDEEARDAAERLRARLWEDIAAHYHPPTGQWAGPHSRAYHDLLPAAVRRELLAAGGVCPSCGGPSSEIHHLPCPDHVATALARLEDTEVERHHDFVRAPTWHDSRHGTTWMDQQACLGSINHEDTWTQRRVLLAYWRLAEAEPAVLRARVLRDGRDFASGCVYQRQHRQRVLTVFGLRRDRGDFHVHLDRPADGLFRASDLRVRYELRAAGAQARALGGGRFALVAGTHQAVVHTVPGHFDGQAVRWESGSDGDHAWVDGICFTGGERVLDPAAVRAMVVVAGLEVLARDQPPGEAAIRVEQMQSGELAAVWDGVAQVVAPMRAAPLGG